MFCLRFDGVPTDVIWYSRLRHKLGGKCPNCGHKLPSVSKYAKRNVDWGMAASHEVLSLGAIAGSMIAALIALTLIGTLIALIVQHQNDETSRTKKSLTWPLMNCTVMTPVLCSEWPPIDRSSQVIAMMSHDWRTRFESWLMKCATWNTHHATQKHSRVLLREKAVLSFWWLWWWWWWRQPRSEEPWCDGCFCISIWSINCQCHWFTASSRDEFCVTQFGQRDIIDSSSGAKHAGALERDKIVRSCTLTASTSWPVMGTSISIGWHGNSWSSWVHDGDKWEMAVCPETTCTVPHMCFQLRTAKTERLHNFPCCEQNLWFETHRIHLWAQHFNKQTWHHTAACTASFVQRSKVSGVKHDRSVQGSNLVCLTSSTDQFINSIETKMGGVALHCSKESGNQVHFVWGGSACSGCWEALSLSFWSLMQLLLVAVIDVDVNGAAQVVDVWDFFQETLLALLHLSWCSFMFEAMTSSGSAPAATWRHMLVINWKNLLALRQFLPTLCHLQSALCEVFPTCQGFPLTCSQSVTFCSFPSPLSIVLVLCFAETMPELGTKDGTSRIVIASKPNFQNWLDLIKSRWHRNVVSNGGLTSPVCEHEKHAIIIFAANQQAWKSHQCCCLLLLWFQHWLRHWCQNSHQKICLNPLDESVQFSDCVQCVTWAAAAKVTWPSQWWECFCEKRHWRRVRGSQKIWVPHANRVLGGLSRDEIGNNFNPLWPAKTVASWFDAFQLKGPIDWIHFVHFLSPHQRQFHVLKSFLSISVHDQPMHQLWNENCQHWHGQGKHTRQSAQHSPMGFEMKTAVTSPTADCYTKHSNSVFCRHNSTTNRCWGHFCQASRCTICRLTRKDVQRCELQRELWQEHEACSLERTSTKKAHTRKSASFPFWWCQHQQQKIACCDHLGKEWSEDFMEQWLLSDLCRALWVWWPSARENTPCLFFEKSVKTINVFSVSNIGQNVEEWSDIGNSLARRGLTKQWLIAGWQELGKQACCSMRLLVPSVVCWHSSLHCCEPASKEHPCKTIQPCHSLKSSKPFVSSCSLPPHLHAGAAAASSRQLWHTFSPLSPTLISCTMPSLPLRSLPRSTVTTNISHWLKRNNPWIPLRQHWRSCFLSSRWMIWKKSCRRQPNATQSAVCLSTSLKPSSHRTFGSNSWATMRNLMTSNSRLRPMMPCFLPFSVHLWVLISIACSLRLLLCTHILLLLTVFHHFSPCVFIHLLSWHWWSGWSSGPCCTPEGLCVGPQDDLHCFLADLPQVFRSLDNSQWRMFRPTG